MLKGISRQIVEIPDTNSPYFERAWLLVKADCAEKSPLQLQEEGERLLRHVSPHTGLKLQRRRQRIRYALLTFLACGGGMLLGFLVFR